MPEFEERPEHPLLPLDPTTDARLGGPKPPETGEAQTASLKGIYRELNAYLGVAETDEDGNRSFSLDSRVTVTTVFHNVPSADRAATIDGALAERKAVIAVVSPDKTYYTFLLIPTSPGAEQDEGGEIHARTKLWATKDPEVGSKAVDSSKLEAFRIKLADPRARAEPMTDYRSSPELTEVVEILGLDRHSTVSSTQTAATVGEVAAADVEVLGVPTLSDAHRKLSELLLDSSKSGTDDRGDRHTTITTPDSSRLLVNTASHNNITEDRAAKIHEALRNGTAVITISDRDESTIIAPADSRGLQESTRQWLQGQGPFEEGEIVTYVRPAYDARRLASYENSLHLQALMASDL